MAPMHMEGVLIMGRCLYSEPVCKFNMDELFHTNFPFDIDTSTTMEHYFRTAI